MNRLQIARQWGHSQEDWGDGLRVGGGVRLWQDKWLPLVLANELPKTQEPALN